MIKGQEMREKEGLSHQACVYAGSVNTHRYPTQIREGALKRKPFSASRATHFAAREKKKKKKRKEKLRRQRKPLPTLITEKEPLW
jgi:hypothetical protein